MEKSRLAAPAASPSAAPAEHFHYEHFPSTLTEGDRGLFPEDLEHARMLAGDLRAHRIRRDLQLRIGVQAIDERLDRRDVVGIERIQADLNCGTHQRNSHRAVTPNCCGSPSCT